MDNKEAIKNIKEHCYFANLNPQAKISLDKKRLLWIVKSLDKAIASLEAWDKVAKEIYERHERYSICRESECIGNVLWSDELIKVSDCLDIIEKYKKEIEEWQINRNLLKYLA